MNLQQAWSHMLSLLTGAASGPLRLTAQQVKTLTGLEPRLATRFDHREARPEALKHSTILPVRNGEYLVVPGDGYHDLEPSRARVISYRVSPDLRERTTTLPWSGTPSSESQVLDMALASGLLGEFLDEPCLHLTVRGRLRAPRFEFAFRSGTQSLPLEVEGVQVEVDAGLEGRSLYLIEAKLGRRDNFHVRQLYYPYRMWRALSCKPVFPVFCCYSDRVFHFWLYDFQPPEDYHGLRLVRQASYSLDEDVGTPLLANLLATTTRQRLPAGVPFPQADRMERVIDLVDALEGGSQDYGFTARQQGYYRNAAAFLGLLEPERQQAFRAGSRAGRHSLILERLVELPVFREACEFMEANARFPSRAWMAQAIAEATGLSGTTLERRARTALAWLHWVSERTLVAHKRQKSHPISSDGSFLP